MEEIINSAEFEQISNEQSPLREEPKDLCGKECISYFNSNNILVLKKLTETDKEPIYIKVN